MSARRSPFRFRQPTPCSWSQQSRHRLRRPTKGRGGRWPSAATASGDRSCLRGYSDSPKTRASTARLQQRSLSPSDQSASIVNDVARRPLNFRERFVEHIARVRVANAISGIDQCPGDNRQDIVAAVAAQDPLGRDLGNIVFEQFANLKAKSRSPSGRDISANPLGTARRSPPSPLATHIGILIRVELDEFAHPLRLLTGDVSRHRDNVLVESNSYFSIHGTLINTDRADHRGYLVA